MEMELNSSQSHVSIAVQDTPGAIDMDTVLSTTSAEPPAHPNLPVQGFVPVGDDELNSLSTSSSEDEENGPETNVSGIQNLPVRRAGRPPTRESQGRESSRNGIIFSEGVPSTISENASHVGRAEVNEMNIASSPFVSDTPFFVSDRIIDRDTSDEESEQSSNRREYDSLHRRNNICPAERLEQVQDKIFQQKRVVNIIQRGIDNNLPNSMIHQLFVSRLSKEMGILRNWTSHLRIELEEQARIKANPSVLPSHRSIYDHSFECSSNDPSCGAEHFVAEHDAHSSDLSLYEPRSEDGSSCTNGSSGSTTFGNVTGPTIVPDSDDEDHLASGRTPYHTRDCELKAMWVEGIAKVRMSGVTDTPDKAKRARRNVTKEAKKRLADEAIAKYKEMDARHKEERVVLRYQHKETLRTLLGQGYRASSMHLRGIKIEYSRKSQDILKRQKEERTTARAANKLCGMELQYVTEVSSRSAKYDELLSDSESCSSFTSRSGSYASSDVEYNQEKWCPNAECLLTNVATIYCPHTVPEGEEGYGKYDYGNLLTGPHCAECNTTWCSTCMSREHTVLHKHRGPTCDPCADMIKFWSNRAISNKRIAEDLTTMFMNKENDPNPYIADWELLRTTAALPNHCERSMATKELWGSIEIPPVPITPHPSSYIEYDEERGDWGSDRDEKLIFDATCYDWRPDTPWETNLQCLEASGIGESINDNNLRKYTTNANAYYAVKVVYDAREWHMHLLFQRLSINDGQYVYLHLLGKPFEIHSEDRKTTIARLCAFIASHGGTLPRGRDVKYTEQNHDDVHACNMIKAEMAYDISFLMFPSLSPAIISKAKRTFYSSHLLKTRGNIQLSATDEIIDRHELQLQFMLYSMRHGARKYEIVQRITRMWHGLLWNYRNANNQNVIMRDHAVGDQYYTSVIADYLGSSTRSQRLFCILGHVQLHQQG